MSDTCVERLVGYVMSISMTLNKVSLEDQETLKRFDEEVARAYRVYAKEIAEYQAGIQAGTVQEQGQSPSIPTDPVAKKRLLDRSLICSVLCCCEENPASGTAGQNLKQGCAHQVFSTADKALGWKGRYKSELSWDMHRNDPDGPKPPTPLMHRDKQNQNQDTTQPSGYWQGRTDEVEGYRIGRGDIRRPDLVIPLDPSKPPSQANMEAVVEFKFGNDRRDEAQDDAYLEIAGGDMKKYAIYRVGGPLRDGEQGCNCYDPMRSPEPVLLPQPTTRAAGASNVARTATALAWTAVAAAGAAVTVLAVLSPFDGPVGDVAAGTATAAAAARAMAAWRAVAPVF